MAAVVVAKQAGKYATKQVTDQVKKDVTRVSDNAQSDFKNVSYATKEAVKKAAINVVSKEASKKEAYNAFTDILNAITDSVNDTETVALGKCLNRCKTNAKNMIRDFKTSTQIPPVVPTSTNFNYRQSGGSNKKQTNKKQTNKKRSNKKRSNKKYY